MKYLSENNVSNKNVLLRCDFNVPVKDNVIIDNSKIIKSLDTIKHLLNNNNRVLILSHFGRVKKEEDKVNNSLNIIYEELKKYIDVEFINDNENIERYLNTSLSKCFLLENTRFTDIPEKRESKNDLELAKYWASFGEVFVLDAFASMHRSHTSTAGIGAYIPTYIGFLAEKELKNLKELIDSEKKLIVIMGGAKVDDKIMVIKNILKKCDKLILTGGILNTFLKVLGKNVGKSLVSEDEIVLESVKEIILNNYNKIKYSEEFLVLSNDLVVRKNIDEVDDNDIIYDNIVNINDILEDKKVIFLNGTCGKFEEDDYNVGTKKLLNDLKNSGLKVFVGGGDVVSSVIKFGFEDNFYYLSSGGGATLEYVSEGKLKALEWIRENGVEN